MEYLTSIGSSDLVMENGIQLKNPGAQKILEKFSQHYGILKIFQERVEKIKILNLPVNQFFGNLIRMKFCILMKIRKNK